MPAIGIDFGNRYSAAAVWLNGRVKIVTNHGGRVTPSCFSFINNTSYIGNAALEQNPDDDNLIFGIKSLIGCQFDDPETTEFLKNFVSYKVDNTTGTLNVVIEHKNETHRFTPVQISAKIFEGLRESSEQLIQMPMVEGVITVPVNFNETQMTGIVEACKMANIDVLHVLSEPTAAALAYGLNSRLVNDRHVLIFDIGYYNLNICIMRISPDSVFEIMATVKQMCLGGADFDNRVLNYLEKEYKKALNVNEISKPVKRKLMIAASLAKRTLTQNNVANINIENIEKGIGFTTSLNRSCYEDMCSDLFKSLLVPIERALTDATIDKAKIDNVVFVGGSTRMPKIMITMKKFFPTATLNHYINPNVVIAYGAALQAAIIKNELHPVGLEKNVLTPHCPQFSKSTENLKAQSSTLLINRSIGDIVLPPIGISVGNKTSCAAVYIEGNIEIIVNEHGDRTTPSCISFTDNGMVTGEKALSLMHDNPTNTILGVTKFMGRNFYQVGKKDLPFKTVNDEGTIRIQVKNNGMDTQYSPEELYLILIEMLIVNAQAYLGTDVTKAIVTLPLDFQDVLKENIIERCRRFDLEIVQVIQYPIAAIIAYRLDKNMPKTVRKILTFDLGPSFLKLTIVIVKPGSEFEIKTNAFSNEVTGDDFDDRLFFYLTDELKVKYKKSLSVSIKAARRLHNAAERAKVALTMSMLANIELDHFLPNFDFYTRVSRQLFEEICKPLFQGIVRQLDNILVRANMFKKDLDDVIFVGGSSLIPKVRETVRQFFGDKVNYHFSISPVEVLAYGAAVQAAYTSGMSIGEMDDDLPPSRKSFVPSPSKMKDMRLPNLRAVEDGSNKLKKIPTITLGK